MVTFLFSLHKYVLNRQYDLQSRGALFAEEGCSNRYSEWKRSFLDSDVFKANISIYYSFDFAFPQ